jgi:hypothetical protein
MRRLSSILLLLLTGALAAAPAWGATGIGKPKTRFVPPPAAAPLELRGPLGATTGSKPSSPAPLIALPAPGQSLAGLSSAGLAAPPPITPLKFQGDPAPLCRAECAKTRIVCASMDDLECDSRWIQCVAGCSGGALR